MYRTSPSLPGFSRAFNSRRTPFAMNTEPTDIVASDALRPDIHYQPLIDGIPAWLRHSSAQRREALGNIKPIMPATLKDAPAHHHAELGKLIARHTVSQNRVDQVLAQLKKPADFAAPLLKAELKTRFGLDLDVRNTFLRLYIPAHIPWLRLKSGAARTWSVSLLDAALHNFESSETETDAFEPASTYITTPSADGLFNVLPNILEKMPITAFTGLCRELDIGERYKSYLHDNLGISNPLVAATLRTNVSESHKAAMTAALQMAQMQKLLSADVHRLILGLLDNLPYLRLRGQPWGYHDLTIMNARLTGIVLFAPDLEAAREAVRVVAYIPDDPEHPIKEYASSAAFAEELGRRLRKPDYQQFFSRFIDHEDRGHFFAQLNNQLAPITWQPIQPGDSRPTWRESPNQRPELRIACMPIKGELLPHLYQSKLNKILNDARVIAVPTATVDQRARWALWDSFAEIASTLLNIAAFIALPFVPFLGELMLAYMAYQLLDETFEGVIDWAEGKATEALEHLMGVVESALLLGGFAVGGVIAASEFRAILPKEIVQFIDRLNAVKTPRGPTRYWQPDLRPYEHPVVLPKDLKPDALGLYPHEGKTLLALENNRYAVSKDARTGQYRIDHPSRADAYKPALKHNDEGAWQTELDQPLSWDQATLLQRIGPQMEEFSPSERERMLTVSGCHENVLRKMHVHNEQLPPLLSDTLKRFKIEQDIQTFIERIGSEHAHDYLKADPVTQFELLYETRGWPDHKVLQLIDGDGQVLWSQPDAKGQAVTIDITGHDGDVIKTLLLTLDEGEIKAILGEAFGEPPSSMDSRARKLRQTLAGIAERKRTTLFGERYRQLERANRPLAQTIIDAEPGLPKVLAEAILDTTSEKELQQLQRGTLSQRLADLTQEARLQVRISRAYEGLDLISTAENPDTHRLALHTLESLPGWSGRVRVEIRQYSHEGPVFDSIGGAEAPEQKVLVLDEEGSFQAFDQTGLELGGTGSFYRCLLQALPDSERRGMNLQISDQTKLHQSIRQHAIHRQDLRSILVQNPTSKPAYDPAVMRLLGGTDGYLRTPPAASTLQVRTHALFPHLSPEQLERFVEQLQRHPNGPRAELTRLYAEHTQLFEDLQSWIADVPQFAPQTLRRYSPEQLAIQRRNRINLAGELQNCWRREMTFSIADQTPMELYSSPIAGHLPQLNHSFSNVSRLAFEGHPASSGMNDFLSHFPGLRRLALRDFRLDSFPEAIARCTDIDELILSDCGITLTPESHTTLSSFQKLKILDLYKNPLGLIPDLGNMPDLNYIDLSETGISAFPSGLWSRPKLRTTLLNGNQIRELPRDLFLLPEDVQAGIDLGENPINQADRERIKQHYASTNHDLGIYAEQADIQRAQRLYPLLDQEQASQFIYRLPGTLIEGKAELTRLENELESLTNNLATWTADIPPIHPMTGAPFTDQQLTLEQWTRDEFKNLVERCWRRTTVPYEYDEDLQPGYELVLSMTITGDLPTLNADFSHVSLLHLQSNGGLTSGAGRFIESFPRLKSLAIHDFRLGSIPDAVFRMEDLSVLALEHCNVTLTPQSALQLAQMEKLDYLNLSNNPLGQSPDLSQMPNIATLMLSNTGITELPAGLLQLRQLDLADLSANAITHIPHDLLELPMEIGESIILRGNPVSEESLQILLAYFDRTTVDFGLQQVIERAELQASDSEDSAIED